jgi:two-component system alkaline phosphatase synthesis response regulator PhoP
MARILVVDDHPNIVRLLRRVLERDGHEVIEAGDGEEALEKIRQEQPRLVVLDVSMPKKSGLEVLHEVRADPALRETIIILLTARDQDDQMAHGLQLGADWYLPKPFAPGDITTLVRRFLDGPNP